MDKSFSQILLDYKSKNSLTQREMAEILGISERMYNYYEKGDYDGNPNKVAKYLQKLSGNKIPNNLKETKGIPVYDVKASAGNGIFNQSENIVEYIYSDHFKDCEAGIVVCGDSMTNELNNGDIIALKRITDFEIIEFGKTYAIQTKIDFELFVKKIRKHTDKNYWLLKSNNKDYDDMDLNISKVNALWRVKGVLKKM